MCTYFIESIVRNVIVFVIKSKLITASIMTNKILKELFNQTVVSWYGLILKNIR